MVVGLLLAQAVIYLSTGWRDGYQNPGLWSLKRHYLRYLPWTLALAVGVGWWMEGFHRSWLEKEPGKPLVGWSVLVAVVRVFVLFPFFGFLILFQFLFLFLRGIGRAMLERVRKRPAPSLPEDLDFMRSTAFWVLLGPMTGMIDTEGRTLTFEIPPSELATRTLRLFPWLLLVLWIWTGAESEDSGERVDPFWLSLAGMVWLGDFILLTWLNRPHWLRRL